MTTQTTFTSRAVIRTVEAGNSAVCTWCGEPVKFKAKLRLLQVIANVYVDGAWNRVDGDVFGPLGFGVKTGQFFRDSIGFPFLSCGSPYGQRYRSCKRRSRHHSCPGPIPCHSPAAQKLPIEHPN